MRTLGTARAYNCIAKAQQQHAAFCGGGSGHGKDGGSSSQLGYCPYQMVPSLLVLPKSETAECLFGGDLSSQCDATCCAVVLLSYFVQIEKFESSRSKGKKKGKGFQKKGARKSLMVGDELTAVNATEGLAPVRRRSKAVRSSLARRASKSRRTHVCVCVCMPAHPSLCFYAPMCRHTICRACVSLALALPPGQSLGRTSCTAGKHVHILNNVFACHCNV